MAAADTHFAAAFLSGGRDQVNEFGQRCTDCVSQRGFAALGAKLRIYPNISYGTMASGTVISICGYSSPARRTNSRESIHCDTGGKALSK